VDNFASRHPCTYGKKPDQQRLIRRQSRRPMRMANRRAINSERKGVRYRSQPVSEKARSRAKAFFKAVAWRRQQEAHSHSRKPSRQRARSRALKAVYAKGEQTILVEIPNIPKSRHAPPPLDRLKQTGKPKRSNRSIKPSKKHAGSRHRAATGFKRNRTARVVARWQIKRLKSALNEKLEGMPKSRHQGPHHVIVILGITE